MREDLAAVQAPPSTMNTIHGWFLGNLYDVRQENPTVFLLFTDPVLEQQYREFARRSCRRGDVQK
jgi:hypothetical protein